ncbi:MAG: acyltransferase family protein [Flavobacteriales bacterium]|nr:acyltransferase family protein [Flavobacteriia bacterium]NCP04989.1 acyltransferase family protein [Flavobacteriales bacterium]NCP51717.1 acyltransferase family protein [Flavobacteriales bacterium]NCP59635.1 acyltransferase family protein [Flavobacteriales bacterium]NCQ14368.1 acyltransferase family protein [Flavobacteriales bacterium]
MNSQKTERLHALDSLRAIMMMLGIVLHSSNTYVVADYGASWPLKDPISTSLYLDWISSFIHAFRMPIFFIVAGFFASLLFHERSSMKMIKNRTNRILLPFIVFVVLLWPLVMIGFTYSNIVFAKGNNPWITALEMFSNLNAFIPGHTMHLWFLYYLVLFSISSFIVGLVFKKWSWFTTKSSQVFTFVIQRPFLKMLVFSLITFLLLLTMNRPWVATSLSFTPDFNTFIFYAFFYFFGWILFKSKSYLNSFMAYDWMFTILGLILFTSYFLMDTSNISLQLIMAIKSVNVWLFIFGFIGLFLRYGSKHSIVMRYVSDSSYWVYLLHLPLTAFLPSLILGFAIPAFLKFVLVMTGTALVCFVSYHYMVRSSFIGKFLNGRTYSRKLKDIKSEPIINGSVKKVNA